jgi:lipid II:glycine glycyltransferase (peptidoglycan interpeptide bridge formation enzyme)
MLEIRVIENSQTWHDFQATISPNLFIQSGKYGKFIEANGDKSFILGVYENQNLIGGSLVCLIKAKRGRFYYLPYGPICQETKDKKMVLSQIKDYLRNLARKDQANFIRISPFWLNTQENNTTFQELKFRPAPTHMLAEISVVLDLTPDLEQILKSMRQNHRNLIRRAERDGIEIRTSQSEQSLKTLHKLLQQTAQRHNFTPFSYNYIKNEFQAFPEAERLIFEAYKDNELLGSAIIFFYGDTAVYRHSGSTDHPLYKKLPFNYLLQWEVIKTAKFRGLNYYNFWGIAPENKPNHPFQGITTFKKGFGGETIELIPCQDYPLNWKYWGNWVIEKIRKWKRGF